MYFEIFKQGVGVKKLLLFLLVLIQSFMPLPIKIQPQVVVDESRREYASDGEEFDLTALQLQKLQSRLIDGLIEEACIDDESVEAIPLQLVNNRTFGLLVNMLGDGADVDVDHVRSVLTNNCNSHDVVLLACALNYLDIENEAFGNEISTSFLEILPEISWDDFMKFHIHIVDCCDRYFGAKRVLNSKLLSFVTPCVINRLSSHDGLLLSVDPTGRYLASVSEDNSIHILDMHANGRCLNTLLDHEGYVNSLSWDPTGRYLASALSDRTIRIWDIGDNYRCVQILLGHMAWVTSVSWDPTGRYLASGSDDSSVRIWDMHDNGRYIQTLHGHVGWTPASVSWDPTGRYLASASHDSTILIWDMHDNGRYIQTLHGHTGWVSSVSWDPTGRFIVSGSFDSSIRVWDMYDNGSCIHTLLVKPEWVSSVKWDQTGRFIVSGSVDGSIRIWDVNPGLNTLQQLFILKIMETGVSKQEANSLRFIYRSLPMDLRRKIAKEHPLLRNRRCTIQ